MLTLFVMLSLENLPDNIELGLELSTWTVLYFISYTVLAAFLIFNLLIGVVITSLEEAHEIETRREDQMRREAAAATEDPSDDRRLELVDQLRELRRTLEQVEHDINAIDEPVR
jgi:voltage-gated sodium channel